LFLEGGSGFVVVFDGGGAGQGADECLDAKPMMQQNLHLAALLASFGPRDLNPRLTSLLHSFQRQSCHFAVILPESGEANYLGDS
jgi:hypothetical protein